MAVLMATLAACGAIVLAAPGLGAAAGAGLTQTPQTVAGTSSLSGIVCPNTASCLAVGRNAAATEGAAAAITGATPSKAKIASAAASLNGIACPTAATCLAVGKTCRAPQASSYPSKAPEPRVRPIK